MFLQIPNHSVLDFDFLKFAEHILDQSPSITTRSQMRVAMKAVDAIATAKAAGESTVEIADDVAKFFQTACEAAPIPRLVARAVDASGIAFGETVPVGARAFEPFHEAVENMTTEAPSAPRLVATAAE